MRVVVGLLFLALGAKLFVVSAENGQRWLGAFSIALLVGGAIILFRKAAWLALLVLLAGAILWCSRDPDFWPKNRFARAGDATPDPTFEPIASREQQAAAIRRYPQLSVAGSPLNREFLVRYEARKRDDPAFFSNAAWPTLLAQECNSALTEGQRQAKPNIPPASWTWRRRGNALDQRARPTSPEAPSAPPSEPGSHLEWSPASKRYVPVPNGSSWRRSVGGG